MSEPDESLRVSDAERDVTLRTLGDHAAVGRLTLDELEERSGRALAAKTRGELAALITDLPAGGAQPGGSPARPGDRISVTPAATCSCRSARSTASSSGFPGASAPG